MEQYRYCYGCGRAGKHESKSEHIELDTSAAERTEKTRTYLQSKFIDKKHKTEVFGILEHAGVDGKTEMSGHNTCKKYKGNTQRDAEETQLAKSKPTGYYH